jgi:hypothetical protein
MIKVATRISFDDPFSSGTDAILDFAKSIEERRILFVKEFLKERFNWSDDLLNSDVGKLAIGITNKIASKL